MKYFYPILLFFLAVLFQQAHAAVFLVNSQQSFDQAHDDAAVNDSIIWEVGTYADIYMDIDKDQLFIGTKELGETIFRGNSKVRIDGDHITMKGFQYVGGNIGTSDVFGIYGSYALITQINIRAYTSYKYLRIRESSQYCVVSYCNFENRLNLDDQNILSILVDSNQPGYHKIQHCSFKNFEGTGNDMGIEPIRIGLSSQANRISRSLVEYCYFTGCDGDGELISSKATQNVYRFNTFENNTKAELVLRHGSEAIVYGNFFLRGKGGIRVREGQNHYIYNNYFEGLNDRALYLQNEASDPLDSIMIAFNTLVDCEEVRLGGVGNNKPTHVLFANNIFTDPKDDLFREPTGTETWIGNVAFGDLGMTLPASGLTIINPLLVENSLGFWGLDSLSPAIDAAQMGYPLLPQFPGMDSIDTAIMFDLMGQDRPQMESKKDLGSNEYPHHIPIQPIATEANTGPSYITSDVSSIDINHEREIDLFHIYPNPVDNQLTISLQTSYTGKIKVEIFDPAGRMIRESIQELTAASDLVISQGMMDLSPGVYSIKVSLSKAGSGITSTQSKTFLKR
ncbi:MAG: chondroitinase-B domain-containing protein [Bacteroidota bacterium]